MKRTICTAVLLTAALAARAQQPESPAAAAPEKAEGGRIYRTEVVPYDTRHDAEERNREAGGYWKASTTAWWPTPRTRPPRPNT